MGAVYTLRSGQHNIYTADVTPLGTKHALQFSHAGEANHDVKSQFN